MLKIIKGILDPRDLARKGARRGVILGVDRDTGAVLVAPCTTYYERTGRVPPGHVLLNAKNCQFDKTGFDRDVILINIRDAFYAAPGSPWIVGAEQIGVLDLDAAPRVRSLIGQALREFPPRATVYQ